MSNWHLTKRCWYISWFNFKNLDEDNYSKKYNIVYQKLKENGLGKNYFKYIFKFMYKEYGIEFVHSWNKSNIIWSTHKNLYWFMWRDSNLYNEYGKWKLRLFKDTNTGDSCG